jgi:hypothetical protein
VLTILRIVLWSPSSLNARCLSKTSSVGVPLAGDNGVRNGRSRGGYLCENTARHCSSFVCSILGLCCPQAGPDWLENLYARPSRPGAPRLLLCDNHCSHDTYEFRKFCLDHDIHLFPLPGHATNILQPLDVVVFSPLDRYCSAAVDDWTAHVVDSEEQEDFSDSKVARIQVLHHSLFNASIFAKKDGHAYAIKRKEGARGWKS